MISSTNLTALNKCWILVSACFCGHPPTEDILTELEQAMGNWVEEEESNKGFVAGRE